MNLPFITPESLTIIILLQESSLETEQSPCNAILQRIMRFYKQESFPSLSSFLQDLSLDLNDPPLINRVRNHFLDFKGINDIYRYLSTTLKGFRCNRTAKLEQGSITDIFLRRALLSFTKWSFDDLVRFQTYLTQYTTSSKESGLHNQFSFDYKLESLRKQVENPSELPLTPALEALKSYRYNPKLDYLLCKAETSFSPLKAEANLHKYFDKTLNSLLQNGITEGNKETPMNKINHAVINKAHLSFKIGHFDETIRSVSEALRLSQNSSDDESINQCLCFLYQLAGILGFQEDQVRLLDYALAHSLALQSPNASLMLYSCLYYCTLERFYPLQKDHWVTGLHYARKKSFSMALNEDLKGLRGLERAVIGLSLLKQGLISGVNLEIGVLLQRVQKENPKIKVQLAEIAYNIADFDRYKGLSLLKTDKFHWFLVHYQAFADKGLWGFCEDIEGLLVNELKGVFEIGYYGLFWVKRIEIRVLEGRNEEAFHEGVRLEEFIEKKGIFKLGLRFLLVKLEIFYRNRAFVKALLLIEDILMKIEEYECFEHLSITLTYKSAFLRELGLIYEAFEALKSIENSFLYNSPLKAQAFFFETKALCLLRLFNENLKAPLIKLKENALTSLNSALYRYIKIGALSKCKEIYYIEARLFDELEKYPQRELAASFFIKTVDLQRKLEDLRHIPGDLLNSPELSNYQEDLQRLIEDNLSLIVLL